MQSEDDSLWESFPQALETLEGVKWYINAFRAPLQERNNLNSNQVYTLRACSILVIPPPTEGMPPSGGFPKDLSELSLSGWAALIQDMAAGLWAVPPSLNLDVGLPTMVYFSYSKPPPEWASVTFAAARARGVSVWEPTSSLPLRHGAR